MMADMLHQIRTIFGRNLPIVIPGLERESHKGIKAKSIITIRQHPQTNRYTKTKRARGTLYIHYKQAKCNESALYSLRLRLKAPDDTQADTVVPVAGRVPVPIRRPENTCIVVPGTSAKNTPPTIATRPSTTV